MSQSLDHTYIMPILYVTKVIMCLFNKKVESIQYNVAPAITGAIRGTSKEKLFKELGLEQLQQQWWYRKLCFYKILKNQSPKYLFNIISKLTRPYLTRNAINIPYLKVKHTSSKILSFRQSLLNGINWTLKLKILLA